MTEQLNHARQFRNFKIAVEYKYLIDHAPTGVYLMPQTDDILFYHGVIFVKKGPYRDGIYRFTLKLPESYNSKDSYPVITFYPPIFHPLVNSETGVLDLKAETHLRNGWQPDRHFLISALLFVKKIFYVRDFAEYKSFISNEVAYTLYTANQAIETSETSTSSLLSTPVAAKYTIMEDSPYEDSSSIPAANKPVLITASEEFLKMAKADSVHSIDILYDNHNYRGCSNGSSAKYESSPIVFSKDHPIGVIEDVRRKIIGERESVSF